MVRVSLHRSDSLLSRRPMTSLTLSGMRTVQDFSFLILSGVSSPSWTSSRTTSVTKSGLPSVSAYTVSVSPLGGSMPDVSSMKRLTSL